MFGKCNFCKNTKFNIKNIPVNDRPSGGHTYSICKKCFKEGKLPKSFFELYGISRNISPETKFIKFAGNAKITDNKYGNNAYGSILAEYSDGRRIGVICGHGGSAWLCIKCAEKINLLAQGGLI